MAALSTLRKELIGAFAVIFAGALFVAVTGVVLVVPRLSPARGAAYVITLLLADIGLFMVLGAVLLRRRLLEPLEAMVAGVEAISRDQKERLPEPASVEMARLAVAVNHMAERLSADRQKLADNIVSLNETNRLLTEARDAMVRSEKLASVGRLGAGIAHEVGNPLGALLGYVSLAARHLDEPHRELLHSAEREARRIDRIVRGLLDFARPRESVAQVVDVNWVVRDTLDLVQTQGQLSNIDIRIDLSAEPVEVRADPYQLQQVFVNLLVNAADALSGEAAAFIAIGTYRRAVRATPPAMPSRRREDPPGIDYSHRRRLAAMPRWPAGDPESDSGYVVEAVVADNGSGIPPELLDQVFEPFVTTKEPGKGTGLGLAVCARIIEVSGGTIRAENAPDGGAIFRIILPALAAEVALT